jgi:hypothetical protein
MSIDLRKNGESVLAAVNVLVFNLVGGVPSFHISIFLVLLRFSLKTYRGERTA